MAPNLVLGPLLRYAGAHDATIWVETNSGCKVEVRVRGSRDGTYESRTFRVEDHHYALVRIAGLEPGSSYEYSVALDGQKVWPEEDGAFPPSVIRTIRRDSELSLAFGSCRIAAPHEPPHTLKRGIVRKVGYYERDALYALACRMRRT